MRPLYTLITSFTLLFISCEKDLSYEGGYVPPTEPPVVAPPVLTEEDHLRELFTENKFQLRAFYSDIPIHFDPTNPDADPETDLWLYVAPYLKDDANIFTENGEVKIEQNSVKKAGLPDEVLIKDYSIGEDSTGFYIMFLDAEYNPFQYRITEVGEDYFILSVNWAQGAVLYSRFEKL